MKTYLYPLLAGLLSLAACTNDTLQEIAPAGPDSPQTGGTPQGTYVVDYSVDGDASTRATGDGKIQISSLDYFLYTEEDGRFMKHRRIAIDPETQQWPLTRDNMTWEQRQFMQDTLSYGLTYRILFVANVDPTLFNYGEYNSDTNPHPEVVVNYRPIETQGEEDTQEPSTTNYGYSDARILLPNVPFRDDNMYCMWNGTLKVEDPETATEAGDGYTIENNTVKLSSTILLQRIVTRTDIQRTDNPTELYKAIEEGFYKDYESDIEQAVSSWIDDFCNKIKNCADYDWDLLLPNGHESIHNKQAEIEQLTNALSTNKNLVITAYKDALIKEYVNIIEPDENTFNANYIYDERTQKWYIEGRTVRAIYKTGTRANALSFDRTPSHYDTGNTENDNEASCGINANGLITLIGFHGNEETSNTITALEFDGKNPFTIKGTDTSFTISQGINDWYKTTCDPCAIIQYNSKDTKTDIRTVNLLQIMTSITIWNDLAVNKDGLKNAADYFWDCYMNHQNNGINNKVFDGYAFDRFPIEATYPNITADNVNDGRIELIPSWTEPEKVVNE